MAVVRGDRRLLFHQFVEAGNLGDRARDFERLVADIFPSVLEIGDLREIDAFVQNGGALMRRSYIQRTASAVRS